MTAGAGAALSPMRIWIFNHYASTPDQPMTGAYYLARELVRRGHSVEIFASSFSYYKRRDLRLRPGQLFRQQSFEGVTFNWIRTVANGSGMLSRALNMLSFVVVALWAAWRVPGRPDIVIGTCPHLPAVWAASLVARLTRARFVYEVRDLWPQTFVDYGALSENGLLTRWLRRLERRLYQRADLITTVLPFAFEYLKSVGVSEAKWVWVPNGLDLTSWPEIPPRESSNQETVFMYLGGMARYQGLDTVLKAARSLQDDGADSARFVLIGDGVEKPSLERMAAELELRNVEFRGAVPRREVPLRLAEADVLIYHLRGLQVATKYGISPNKLCDYLIAGRPILFAADTRNNPVAEAEAGVTVPPEDPRAMAEACKRLLALPQSERRKMGENGRRFARASYAVDILAERLETALGNTLQSSSTESAVAARSSHGKASV